MLIKGTEDTNFVDTRDNNMMWVPIGTESHQLELLRTHVNEKCNLKLSNYQDLHKWSIKEFRTFWRIALDWLNIKHSGSSEKVLAHGPMDTLPPKWFPDVTLNYSENLLSMNENTEKIAYYFTSEKFLSEGLPILSRTFTQFKHRVGLFASALRKAGVVRGDRVVGYLPNCPEAVEAMAGAASIGAIWSSTSPDFGVTGVLERFKQIKPKVIFSVEAVSYNLKTHDHTSKIKSVMQNLPETELVVMIPFLSTNFDVSSIPKAILLDSFLQGIESKLIFEPLPFSAPLFIMFSSGTTGVPKCIVHSVGGTLIKHLEEHRIQANRNDSDILLYYTTTGWMMWNWMVSAMCLGTSIVLYDGSPLHPTPEVLWDLTDKLGITVFGTSAKWLAVQQEKGIVPLKTHELRDLKVVCSTGSPLKPESFDYVYNHIKPNIRLSSITGGTDIIACFLGENSVLPVHKGELQSAHLGCDIKAWEAEPDGPGEFICATPFPSMPVGFWNDDPKNSAYRKAYFDKYPGIWAHGDFVYQNPDTDGFVMLGRSDGTLNPNGVRFGSSEIYNVVESGAFSENIADSLCVGQKSINMNGGEERVILFLKMKTGKKLDDSLIAKLKSAIRSALSVRHVPSLFLETQDIPYTINGKKVEVAVKKILSGLPVVNTTALANPECLNFYRNVANAYRP